jgi:hypothetical protein
MRKTIELSVPVPCHENWNGMTPNERGRFCLSCQKSVVDFTTMSDQELIFYFKRRTEQTCGRFRTDQLHKEMFLEPPKKLHWFKYFMQLLIPTVLVTARGYAQGKPKVEIQQKKPVVEKVEYITMGIIGTDKKERVVIDSPKLEKTTIKQNVLVQRRSVPHKPLHPAPLNDVPELTPIKSIPVKPLSDSNPQVMKSHNEFNFESKLVCVVGGAVSVRRSRMAASQIIEKVVKDSLKVVFDKPRIEQIKIYPNPVHSSSTMNIEYRTNTSGEFTIVLVDMNGIAVQRERLIVESGLISRQLQLNNSLTRGTYALQVIGPTAKVLATQKIIVLE